MIELKKKKDLSETIELFEQSNFQATTQTLNSLTPWIWVILVTFSRTLAPTFIHFFPINPAHRLSFFSRAQTPFFRRSLCFLPRLWYRGIETGTRKASLFGGAEKSPHCSSRDLRVGCREAGGGGRIVLTIDCNLSGCRVASFSLSHRLPNLAVAAPATCSAR